MYRPPNYDEVAKNYLHLTIEGLKKYSGISHSTIIVGDFNLPKISWCDFTCGSDCFSTLFRDFVVTCGFYQFVKFSTRENSLLDLVLSSDTGIVCYITPKPPFGHSDHSMVNFKLNACSSFDSSATERRGDAISGMKNIIDNCTYFWYKADFVGLEQSLSQINWDTFICLNPDATCVWTAFLSVL